MKKIAIIGMACKFPGGANSLEEFWQLMIQKKDAIVEVPSDRWDTRKFYSKHEDKPGKSYVKEAGFFDTSVYGFDPLFFGMTPREAECMDPQQRILLQVTWNAIEDSGLTLAMMQQLQTGVFVGCFTLDNLITQLNPMNINLTDSSSPTSSTMAVVANRVSHVFNFKGPSIAMDTACSSSLVSTHLACQSILNGESDVAIAAGVNVITRPEYPTLMSKGNFLSKHGRCKTFDEDAGGYTRGEGVGSIILKSYEKAVEDGDRIYSVISASGLNQDGATVGMASPNGESQENLIRSVYKKAHISPNDVQYVEAHGTGTQAGDKAETSALGKVFREKVNGKVIVGSVKTNIGHLEAAAGIASLIKTSLCLYNKKLVPNLHFNHPNPNIDFDAENIEVSTQNRSWPEVNAGEKRRASINSFGYGGTNAHVLLESSDNLERENNIIEDEVNKKYLIQISANDKQALKEVAISLSDYIEEAELSSLATLSYQLLNKKSLLNNSYAFWSDSMTEVVSLLKTFALTDIPEKGICEELTKNSQSKVGFVMTGMGPQWQGMGKDLYTNDSLFKSALDSCDELFKKVAGWSLLEEILKGKDDDSSRMSETAIAQPANFFIQVGLMAMINDKGFYPDAVVGHSVGEVAAAYFSGMLSLEDAILVSYHRSRLQQTTSGSGTMLALGISEQEAKELIKGIEYVDIAAVNASNAVTLSGERSALEQVEVLAKEKDIFNRFLAVEIAYHGYQMDAIQEDILESLKNIHPQKPSVALYSTVTAKKSDHVWDNQYWWQNVRQPVSFEKSIKTMIADGYDHFLEVGPHPVLKTSLEGIFKEQNFRGFRTHTLNRKESEAVAIENTSAWLHAHGFKPRDSVQLAKKLPPMSLPPYPFQNEEYRRESKETVDFLQGNAGNVFLNNEMPEVQPTWEVELSDGFFPFVEDHVVQNNVVFPGACYVEAGLAIANELKDENESFTIEALSFSNMLIVNTKAVQMLKTSYNLENRTYQVHSRNVDDEYEWKEHAKGKIYYYEEMKPRELDLYSIRKKCTTEVNVEELYEKLDSVGLQYGPSFRGIKNMIKSDSMVVASIKADDSLDWDEHFFIQPALLDACFQSMIGLIDLDTVSASYVPVQIKELQFYKNPGLEFNCFIELKSMSEKEIIADIHIADDFGEVSASLNGIRCKAINQKKSNAKDANLDYSLSWIKKDAEMVTDENKTSVLVLSDQENECIRNAPWLDYFETAQFALAKEVTRSDKPVETALYFLNDLMVPLKDKFENLKELILKHEKTLTTLIIVSENAAYVPSVDAELDCTSGAFASLFQVISNEYPTIECKSIDVQKEYEVVSVIKESLCHIKDSEVALRNNERFVLEMQSLIDEEEADPFEMVPAHEGKYVLQVIKAGSVEGLEYIKENNEIRLKPGEVRIKTLTSSLNFKDLLKVYGQISDDVIRGTFFGDTIGMELCGEVVEIGREVDDFKVGDNVLVPINGSFSTFITIDANYLVKAPPKFSVEEAPIFIGFLTAYYGLHHIARLKKGEKVLIHNGTGGVGLAAIQVAQWIGAEIYTTAGTPEKRTYLKSLGVEHVYNSRSIDFYHQIKGDTKDYGVDVVLNALSGAALEKSFNLLAPYGRFVEIGKKDIGLNSGLAMKAFNEALQFTSIDIDRMLNNRLELLKDVYYEVFDLFDSGAFKPIPVESFKSENTKDAFTFMAQSKHVGKVVIDYRDAKIEVRKSKGVLKNKDGLIIVTGGTGGFGFQISKALAEKTGYHVVAVSRSGIKDENDQKVFEQSQKEGLKLYVDTLDITEKENVNETLQLLEQEYGPLKGVVHSAVVLDDGFIRDLSSERFERVLHAKIDGARNLGDYCLEHQCDLDFFVSFSSISSLIGNPGQANYVVANRFLDLYTSELRLNGIQAYTINWGVLGESGLLSKNETVGKLLESFGINPLSNQVAIDHFFKVLSGNQPQVGVFDLNWKKWATSFKKLSETSKFKTLANESDSVENPLKTKLLNELGEMSIEESQEFVLSKIKDGLSYILKLSSDKIEEDISINNLGVDSLMAVEVLVMIEKELFVELTTVDLLNGPTVNELSILTKDRLLKK